ncbi:MAG: MMPL family transporter [Gemmatimonadaceae bacterium]
MKRIAGFIVRRRKWIFGLWAFAALILIPPAARVERELEVAARVRGSEAEAVGDALRTRFESPFAQFALLVVTGVPAPSSSAGAAVLRSLVASVDSVPGVSGTFSYLDVSDTLFAGKNASGTYVVVGLDPADGRVDDMVVPLRTASQRIATRLRATHPGARLRWTGEVPINFDLRLTSADEARRAERSVLPLTLVLLLLAFGAVVAALLPLLAAALAITITLGAAVLINGVWPLSILLQNTVSMIGLGVGIDYALLTVSRFREGLAAGLDREAAAIETAEHAGTTVVLSGLAVMIGFVALLLVPLNELQSTGLGGLLVVGLSVLAAATLLPGILAILGPRVDKGSIFRRRAAAVGESRRWRAWGRWVVRNPVLVLVVAGAPVIALAFQSTRLNAELPRGNWLPPHMESARALSDLSAMDRGGVVNSLRVLVDLPSGVTVLDSAGWAAARRVTARLRADRRIGRVQSIATVLPFDQPSELFLAQVPNNVRRALVTADLSGFVLEVVPNGDVAFNDLTQLTRDLRALDHSAISGVPGTRIRVGGMPAFNADYIDVIGKRFFGVVTLVVLATMIALMAGFRSVLIPVKAVALNLLSVAAAFGALVLVFQDGHGSRLLGMTEPLHGVFPAVPILVFCIVFGLSMDYEVFLVSRVAEARRTHADSDAIIEGLARTGGVITSAAAIMIVVFAAFTLGDFLFIKALGFTLAVAVLLDATVVRIAIGPALLQLAGRWNWWPGDQRADPVVAAADRQ